jgi:hypothetical protein
MQREGQMAMIHTGKEENQTHFKFRQAPFLFTKLPLSYIKTAEKKMKVKMLPHRTILYLHNMPFITQNEDETKSSFSLKTNTINFTICKQNGYQYILVQK